MQILIIFTVLFLLLYGVYVAVSFYLSQEDFVENAKMHKKIKLFLREEREKNNASN